jgi:NADH dehydrogenase/NADH:ubiquinone oxidoreductase subunit G
MENLNPSGACRICVVEVDGFRGLVPSCSYPVTEGMNIHSRSPRVIEARKTITRLLLANHPDDCLYCNRSGNCELQTISTELGVRQRLYSVKKDRQKLDVSSPSIVRDPEKCILCGRCVRMCEESSDRLGHRLHRPRQRRPSYRHRVSYEGLNVSSPASTAASALWSAPPGRSAGATPMSRA